MILDFNSTTHFADRINFFIDAAIAAKVKEEKVRDYLGASVIGHDCERHVQYHLLAARGEIQRKAVEPRISRIFDRGNVYEAKCRALLSQAGFVFDPGVITWPHGIEEQAGFEDFDGRFKGHIDGKLNNGPDIGLLFPALWEHKCLGSKSWKKLEKEKLKSFSSTYYAQVQIYMHYMFLHTCLFSATNADTMEIYHEVVPYNGAEAESLIKRVGHVFLLTDASEFVPRFTQDRSHYQCKWCDFYEVCW
jgi:hypothetical protein